MKELLDKIKRIALLVGVFLLISFAMCGVDSLFVFGLRKKPVFTPFKAHLDEAGNGQYLGFCYSFDISGDFDDGSPRDGVTDASLYIFGSRVAKISDKSDE